MNDTPSVARIAHVNMRGSESLVERLRTFYVDVIGLRDGPRPRFRSGSSGYWLYAGDLDVMHLSIDPTAVADPPATAGTTAFNHVAFACRGLADTMHRLRVAGIDFRIDQVDDMDQVQLFLFDPAGTRIELNFTGEPLPA
jgi:catechol 2,3-dioxygenase-like lactoylglutathione lyase family enzyme